MGTPVRPDTARSLTAGPAGAPAGLLSWRPVPHQKASSVSAVTRPAMGLVLAIALGALGAACALSPDHHDNPADPKSSRPAASGPTSCATGVRQCGTGAPRMGGTDSGPTESAAPDPTFPGDDCPAPGPATLPAATDSPDSQGPGQEPDPLPETCPTSPTG